MSLHKTSLKQTNRSKTDHPTSKQKHINMGKLLVLNEVLNCVWLSLSDVKYMENKRKVWRY